MNTTNPNPDEIRKREGDWKVPHRVLLGRLAHGWRATAADVAGDFVSRWSTCLQCEVNIKVTGESFLRFTSDLGSIRFAGMHDVACLLLAGTINSAREVADDFWRRTNSPGKAVIILAATAEAEEAARQIVPPGRYTLLGPESTAGLLESDTPLQRLKQDIRQQVSPRRLIPFDTEHPIEGLMFCGRTKLLSRLLEEEDVNFAVAGPGRIGKTSLMKRYLELLLRSKDNSWSSKYYIDLMSCSDRSADGLARFIALRVDSSRKVSHLTCDRVEQFFSFQRDHHGRPIDLLLDETDEFLTLETFKNLGNAARKGLCRVVLAGRGNLLRTVLGKNSPLQHRMELLRLDPLSDVEAENLLFRPLEDLGYSISDPHRVLEQVSRLTGKLPHYLQFYGRRMSELLIDGDFQTVSCALVAKIRDEFETTKLFTDPIFEVKSPRTRFAALALLGAGCKPLSLPQIQGIVHNQGLAITLDELWEIVNELVIQSVLAWNQGRFQVANESLPHYSHSQGLLGSAIREVRAQISKSALAS